MLTGSLGSYTPQNLQQDSIILHRLRQWSSLIRAPASGPHVKAADAAKGRLHPDEPAVAGRVAHGTAGVSADRGQPERRSDSSTRATAGGARAACEVPRVAATYGAGGVPPDLRDDFAHQDATGRFQARVQRGTLLGPVVDTFGITESGTRCLWWR